MSRLLSVAALQTQYGLDMADNIARTGDLIRQAAAVGARVILPSELFQGPYFCISQEERWFATAHPWRTHPCVQALAPLAAELGVVLPLSIFEREGPHYFNSLVMIDADGALMGADVLLYPTAIGSEPHDPRLDTALPWRRAMQGHAVSNIIPVVGANRTGFEPWERYPGGGQRFYGSSFIADHRGDLVGDLGPDDEGVTTATFDLDFLDRHRAAWGFFRDRRPDLYGALAGPRPA